MDNWSETLVMIQLQLGSIGRSGGLPHSFLEDRPDVGNQAALKMDPARTGGSEGSSVYSSVNSGRSGVHTGSAKRGWTLHGARARGEAHAKGQMIN